MTTNDKPHREFWIRQTETVITKECYWQVHSAGVWLENKEAVSKFIHVIEFLALEAEREKFEKCNEQSTITIRETAKENVAMRKKVKELEQQCKLLRAELLAAKETIEFYADESNFIVLESIIDDDGCEVWQLAGNTDLQEKDKTGFNSDIGCNAIEALDRLNKFLGDKPEEK